MARRNNFPNVQEVKTAPGEMGKMVSRALSISEIGKTGTPKTPDEWRERITQYFTYCIDNDMRPGVENMALACGCSRQNLWQHQKSGAEVGQIIDRAKQTIAALTETWSLEGKLNPATSCFLLKNHFGYSDTQRLEIEPRNPLGAPKSMEEIAASIPQDFDFADCVPDDMMEE